MNQPLMPTDRRIFLGTDAESFQIFSITQSRQDGSIYFAAPGFEEIVWIVPAVGEDQKLIFLSYQSGGDGKLSLHGSGVTHVRPYDRSGTNGFSIRGNELRSRDGDRISARHLMTIFPSEPKHRPNSPAGARKSDEVLTTKYWHPYVIIFWAVPANQPLTVNVRCSFEVDDLEEMPPNSGWGGFSMVHHSIVFFAYRTKHMERWPLNSQAFYSDGHTVPMVVGTGAGQFRVEYRVPEYTLNDGTLSIQMDAPATV